MDRLSKIATALALTICATSIFLIGKLYLSLKPSFADTLKAKTFHIKIFKDAAHTQFAGAGSAIYLRNNMLLSAGHVCEGQNPLLSEAVETNFKIHQPIKFIIDERPGIDLCLVQLAAMPKQIDSTPVAAANSNVMGSRVYIPGFSGGYVYSIRQGTVYLENTVPIFGKDSIVIMRLQAMTVIGMPGISGSGVISEAGEIVGVANAVGPTGLMMVPLDDIRSFLEKHGLLQ